MQQQRRKIRKVPLLAGIAGLGAGAGIMGALGGRWSELVNKRRPMGGGNSAEKALKIALPLRGGATGLFSEYMSVHSAAIRYHHPSGELVPHS